MPSETPDGPAAHGQSSLASAIREIEQFVGSAGWDQPAQMFALVPTEQLLSTQPELADQLGEATELTPIAQESLPSEDLGEALSRISWPEQVAGCALVQEIVVLPPEAESDLPEDPEQAREVAAEHPHRQEARLVAGVLRTEEEACLMRLRTPGDDGAGDLVEDRTLAPNLLRALHGTFAE
ncbi:hypothetical protein GIY23_04790 [Allosaccharopolyspora coralli]|uniref:Uncharacterized protein n=1 Tax=Allosaccharopolyspora coralli TaxID=2665642 RepID=A0A5Q3QBU8_9PSEU|nr:PPA1309 family protein [Allosaccharopolyspora coralli]QGK68945.1 hypothetical protein GIY23_04790 [Allosaccharopolyspora coralli]